MAEEKDQVVAEENAVPEEQPAEATAVEPAAEEVPAADKAPSTEETEMPEQLLAVRKKGRWKKWLAAKCSTRARNWRMTSR